MRNCACQLWLLCFHVSASALRVGGGWRQALGSPMLLARLLSSCMSDPSVSAP